MPGNTSMRSELRTRCRPSSGIISKWKPFIHVPTCAVCQHSVMSSSSTSDAVSVPLHANQLAEPGRLSCQCACSARAVTRTFCYQPMDCPATHAVVGCKRTVEWAAGRLRHLTPVSASSFCRAPMKTLQWPLRRSAACVAMSGSSANSGPNARNTAVSTALPCETQTLDARVAVTGHKLPCAALQMQRWRTCCGEHATAGAEVAAKEGLPLLASTSRDCRPINVGAVSRQPRGSAYSESRRTAQQHLTWCCRTALYMPV